MGRSTWVILAVALCAAAPVNAETIDADSHIVSVTVFSDRAGVTRAADLKLSKGSHEIRIAPLPSQIEPDSVSAKGAGQAQVTLEGVRVVTTQLETAQDPRVKALEDDIKAATRQQQQWHNTKQVLEQEREYLASIQAASSEQIGKDLITKSPSAADASSLLAFLDEALLKNFERDQEADVKLDELAQQLDRFRRELATLTQGRFRQDTAIVASLEAHDGGTFHLEVSYRVPGATWQPSYEARAATGSSDIELMLAGLIRQQTGEDWTDVQLTLSTAKPAIAGSMPKIQPWFLRPWEPPPVYPLKASRMMMKREQNAASAPEEEGFEAQGGTLGDEVAPAPERKANISQALVGTQGPAVTFTLPKPASIPSDWQPHKVSISGQRFGAELAYETTPRLVPYAFLRAKVTNTTQTVYLSGPVSVFLDEAFVATASLKQIAPGEVFDLYLGVDERVKVERKPLKERVDISLIPGLRGKTKSTDYEVLTTIENFTGRRIAVTVFDQVPVSEREEIVVESIKQTPATVEKDPEKPGVFRWVLDLSPSQKQELRLAYRIRHPVDLQVQ